MKSWIMMMALSLVACEGIERRQPAPGPTFEGQHGGTPSTEGDYPEVDEVRPDHEPPAPPATGPADAGPPAEEPPAEEPPAEEPPAEEPPAEEPPAEEPPAEEPPAEEPPAEEPPAEEPCPCEAPEEPGLEVLVRLVGRVGTPLQRGPLAGVVALIENEILNGHAPLCDIDCVGGADRARLIEVLVGGEHRLLGEGQVDDGRFAIDVLHRPLHADSLLIVELLSGERPVGGRFLAAGLALDGDQVLAPIDPESTLEARVAVAITERGIETDLCLVARLIDGAISLAVRHEGDIEALVESIVASQFVFARVLGEAPGALASGCRMSLTQWEALRHDAGGDGLTLMAYDVLRIMFENAGFDAEHQADAIAQSTAAFEAVIDLLVGADSALGQACGGRGQLENAIAAVAALGGHFEGGDLQGALAALIAATVEARDGEAVAHAGAAFEGTLHGLLDLVVEVSLVGRLGLPLVEATLDRCLDAGQASQVNLVAAIRAAASLGDAEACADAVVAAFARHQGGLGEVVAELLAVVALDAEGRGLAGDVIRTATCGLYGNSL